MQSISTDRLHLRKPKVESGGKTQPFCMGLPNFGIFQSFLRGQSFFFFFSGEESMKLLVVPLYTIDKKRTQRKQG